MKKEKLIVLRWYDIGALTFILFAYAIYTSTAFLISFMVQPEISGNVMPVKNASDFSDYDNYFTLLLQLIFLLLGFIYLKFRKFDFKTWPVKFSIKAFIWGVLFFLIISLCMDIYNLLVYYIPYLVFPGVFMQVISGIKFSTVLYAVLNGFYEEIFFLGICTSVQTKYKKWAFLYSLIVRISFHTYNGIYTAIGLGLILGILFYFLYEKTNPKNLLPFFIAHAIADILGLSVIGYFYYA